MIIEPALDQEKDASRARLMMPAHVIPNVVRQIAILEIALEMFLDLSSPHGPRVGGKVKDMVFTDPSGAGQERQHFFFGERAAFDPEPVQPSHQCKIAEGGQWQNQHGPLKYKLIIHDRSAPG